MYGHKIKTCVITITLLCFVLCHGGLSKRIYAYANGGNEVKKTDKLIVLATEIAQKNNIDVNNCDVRIKQENNFITIVEFWPNINQLGGGGKLFFKKLNDEYTFIKIELWQ
ncbi:MAG: hypothetical protein A4E64_01816 [Syntrophorhabdus sp. PtaU1.Bin058]|nr:MAG: hypothetical protein A4E64_01816 [Syntrophorhabdus sp. PtaU1.Bin058]